MRKSKLFFFLLIILLSSCSVNSYGEDGWDELKLNYINPEPMLQNMDDDCKLIDFSNVSNQENLEIFSTMEEFMYRKHLGGIPIMEYENNQMSYLLVNSFTKEEYIEAYNEEWYNPECFEKALQNEDFIKGMSLSINRELFANKHNATATVNYYPSNIMFNGVSYNKTKEHNDNLLKYYDNDQTIIDNNGYSLSKAKQYFEKSCETFLSEGIYKENDTIKIKITFSGVNSFLEELFKNVELTFNDTEVCDEKLKLDIILVDDTISWLLGTENAYSIGCFQMYYASNLTLDSSNKRFISYKHNKVRQNRLNNGVDTFSGSNTLIYKNQIFTYDALATAMTNPCMVSKEGELVNLCDAILVSDLYDDIERQRTVTIKYSSLNIDEICKISLSRVELFKNNYTEYPYYLQTIIEHEDLGFGNIKIIVPYDLMVKYEGTMSYKLVFSVKINDKTLEDELIELESTYTIV